MLEVETLAEYNIVKELKEKLLYKIENREMKIKECVQCAKSLESNCQYSKVRNSFLTNQKSELSDLIYFIERVKLQISPEFTNE